MLTGEFKSQIDWIWDAFWSGGISNPRAFLQHVWNSAAVRRQVESLARTTNGTFKVNQTMLEGITFVAPLLPLQHDFARRVAAVEKLKTAHRASLAELDALFAALQHRAFRGEL